MALVTLQRRGHDLLAPDKQIELLESLDLDRGFGQALESSSLFPLRPTKIDIFQINVGRVCNQTCAHCHVDAGPDRKELMSDEVLDRCLEIFEKSDIGTIEPSARIASTSRPIPMIVASPVARERVRYPSWAARWGSGMSIVTFRPIRSPAR